jgi:CCR4-NOT transcriptional regulation complex NOT5 subunit
MLHDLQEEKRTKKLQINSQEEQEEKEENGHFTSDEIDRILDSMTNAQITTMLRQEGIAYHQVKDCQEFRVSYYVECTRYVFLVFPDD